jgi:TonB family protein
MHRIGRLALVTTCIGALSLSPYVARAQSRPDRRVVDKSAPVYPELAKRTHMRGVVKLEVVVRANGSVKSTRVVGGNPVLLDAADDAVHKWKFEPGSQETTEVVQISFEAR